MELYHKSQFCLMEVFMRISNITLMMLPWMILLMHQKKPMLMILLLKINLIPLMLNHLTLKKQQLM
jgi:hypothetical protein